MSNLFFLLRQMKFSYPLWIGFMVFLVLLNKLMMAGIPLGVKFCLDSLHGDVEFGGWVASWSLHWSMVVLGLCIAIFMISFCLQFVSMSYFGQNFMFQIRIRMMNKILSQSLRFFDKLKPGDILTRIVHDVQVLYDFFVGGIIYFIGDVFLICLIFIFCFILSPHLFIVNVIVLMCVFALGKLFKSTSFQYFFNVRKIVSSINTLFQSVFGGVVLIQIFNQQKKIIRRFNLLQAKYLRQYLQIVKLYAGYFSGVEFLGNVFRFCLLMSGAYWISLGMLKVSTLLTFLLYSKMFFRPIEEIVEQYGLFYSSFASMKRISDVLKANDEIQDKQVSKIISRKECGKIEFRNVFFRYSPDTCWILNNVSFVIFPGEHVALLGLTGSGKSTIVKLLNRFYEPEKGEILINDVPIQNLSLSVLRSFLSYVMQDVGLFSGTFAENISLFDLECSDDVVRRAACLSGADEFISSFEHGYRTTIGEHGMGLSHGQKQMIAFSRALSRPFEILILDEATSNVDFALDARIRENIRHVVRDKTMIVIAHRLSTVLEVDNVILIDKGCVLHSGLKQSLFENKKYGKIYRQLIKEYEKTDLIR